LINIKNQKRKGSGGKKYEDYFFKKLKTPSFSPMHSELGLI
jgi:hypothetical protein